MTKLIAKYMTPAPVCVGKEETLETAKRILYEHGIKHLPVLDGDKLYGVITDRDVKLILAVEGGRAWDAHVGDVCTTELYVVSDDTSLSEACSQMASREIGCCLVVDKDWKLLGIFTVTDACKVLSSIV